MKKANKAKRESKKAKAVEVEQVNPDIDKDNLTTEQQPETQPEEPKVEETKQKAETHDNLCFRCGESFTSKTALTGKTFCKPCQRKIKSMQAEVKRQEKAALELGDYIRAECDVKFKATGNILDYKLCNPCSGCELKQILGDYAKIHKVNTD